MTRPQPSSCRRGALQMVWAGWLALAILGCKQTDPAHACGPGQICEGAGAPAVVTSATNSGGRANSGLETGARAGLSGGAAAPSSADAGVNRAALPSGTNAATAGAAGGGQRPPAVVSGGNELDAGSGSEREPPLGTSDDPQAPACTGKRATPGESQRQIMSGGVLRSFLFYVPTTLNPGKAAPLVFVFHGAGMTARSMRDLTGFEQLADEKGFIVIFPEGGADLTWNIRPKDTTVCGVGERFTNPDVDDSGFVKDMLRAVEIDSCLDRGHVFSTGFSMGGYFTHHLACQQPGLLRAAAAHSSGTYKGPCQGKVPMLIIHSSRDIAVDPACGTEARDLWIERNGCGQGSDAEQIKQGSCEKQHGCPEHGQVTFCATNDVCHAWSGRGAGAPLCPDFGSGPSNEDATALIWRFFAANW